jgi:hypothetical protein
MKSTTKEHQEAALGAEATGYVDTDPGESLLETMAVGSITPSNVVPRAAGARPGDHIERVARR